VSSLPFQADGTAVVGGGDTVTDGGTGHEEGSV